MVNCGRCGAPGLTPRTQEFFPDGTLCSEYACGRCAHIQFDSGRFDPAALAGKPRGDLSCPRCNGRRLDVRDFMRAVADRLEEDLRRGT